MDWTLFIPWAIAFVSVIVSPLVTIIVTCKQLKHNERIKEEDRKTQLILSISEQYCHERIKTYVELFTFLTDEHLTTLTKDKDKNEILFKLLYRAKLWSEDETTKVMDELYQKICSGMFKDAEIKEIADIRLKLLSCLRKELSPKNYAHSVVV